MNEVSPFPLSLPTFVVCFLNLNNFDKDINIIFNLNFSYFWGHRHLLMYFLMAFISSYELLFLSHLFS